MAISIPTSAVICVQNPEYILDEEDHSVKRYPYIGYGSSQKVEVPSFFDEKPSLWEGNDVCHIKPLTLSAKAADANLDVLLPGIYKKSRSTETVYAQALILFEDLGVTNHVICSVSQGYDGRATAYSVTHEQYVLDPKSSHSLPEYYTNARGYAVGYIFSDGSVSQSYNVRYGYPTDAIQLLSSYVNIYRSEHGYTSAYYYSLAYDFANYIADHIQRTPVTYNPRNLASYVQSRIVINSSSMPSPDLLLLDEFNLTRYGYSSKPYAAYHLKALRQQAYLDALDKVPQLNENSISNVIEIVAFLKAIIIDHRVEIPRSLQSAWLAYRYSYTTTKLDMEEAVGFVYRSVDKDLLGKGFSCYGRATDTISGTPVVMKCHLSMKQKELSYLDSIFTSLYRYGLTPSFYVIWDMIPYSFIVDWFIPVGDILNGYDKTRMYDRTYDITDVWYSLKYEFSDRGTLYSAYTRWGESSPAEFEGYYTLENKGTPSDKTIGFRILDTLSLIFA